MSGRPDYVGAQDAPLLVIAVCILGYVLIVISVWWARHHADDKLAQQRAKDAQLRKELRRYESESIWDD